MSNKSITINVQTGERTEGTIQPHVEKPEPLPWNVSRMNEYPPLVNLADAMYWASKGDDSHLTAYYAACEAVKTKYPKPEAE